MKRHLLFFALLGLTAHAQDGGNLIMNGGFEAGIQFWKGDGKIERLPDGGRVCEIEAARNRLKDITQEFRMKGVTQVEIVFRARSLKYTGTALRISVHQPGGGSIIYNRDLPSDGSWKDFRLNYLRPNAEERRELIIATMVGTGTVQIDDVEVRPPSQTIAAAAPAPTAPPSKPAPATPVPAPPAPLATNRPATPAPLRPTTPIPAPPAAQPALVAPAGGFASFEQIIQTVSADVRQKLGDPATAAAALEETNAILAQNAKGKPAVFRTRIELLRPNPGGGNKVRFKSPDAPMTSAPMKQRLWAHFREEPDPTILAVGAEVAVAGVMSRCDVTKEQDGLRLNVDLQRCQILGP